MDDFANNLILSLKNVSDVNHLTENEFQCLDNKGNILIIFINTSYKTINKYIQVWCANQMKTYTNFESIFPIFSFLKLKFKKIMIKEANTISSYLIDNTYLPKDLCNAILQYNEFIIDIINDFVQSTHIFFASQNKITIEKLYFEMLLDPFTKFIKINNNYTKKYACNSDGDFLDIESKNNKICFYNRHKHKYGQDMIGGVDIYYYHVTNMSSNDFLEQVNMIVDEIR